MPEFDRPWMASSNLEVALGWARHGFRVLPTHNKRALIPWKTEATADPESVRQLWGKFPDAEPAIVTDNVCVFDCDTVAKRGEDGVAGFHALCEREGIELSGCLQVRTPSGGLHVYFRHDGPSEIGNRTGDLPKGIDVRSSGRGYVLAPGTTLADGRRYAVVNEIDPDHLPSLPERLVELLVGRHIGEQGAPPMVPSDDDVASLATEPVGLPQQSSQRTRGQQVLQKLADELSKVPEGERGSKLNKIAFRAGRFAASGDMDQEEVEARLFEASLANGLVAKDGHAEVRDAIVRAMTDGGKRPARLPERPRKELLSQKSTSPKNKWPGLLMPSDVDILDGPLQLVPRLICEGEIGVLTGIWGAGKTFLAIDIAIAVANGLPIGGLTPQVTGRVLYLSAEGQASFMKRVHAAVTHRGLAEAGDMFVYRDVPDLADPEDVANLIDEVGRHMSADPVALIIIDTLARAMKSASDSDVKMLKPAIEGLLRLGRVAGVAVLVLHHPPVLKEEGGTSHRRPRGGGMIEGDTDFSLFLESDPDDPELKRVTIRKAKDLSDDTTLCFRLTTVELGSHRKTGEPVTTKIIEYVDPTGFATKAAAQPVAGLEFARNYIETHGLPDMRFGLRKSVLKKDLNTAIRNHDDGTGTSPDSRIKQLNRLLQAGHLVEDSGYIAVPSMSPVEEPDLLGSGSREGTDGRTSP